MEQWEYLGVCVRGLAPTLDPLLESAWSMVMSVLSVLAVVWAMSPSDVIVMSNAALRYRSTCESKHSHQLHKNPATPHSPLKDLTSSAASTWSFFALSGAA